MFATEIMVFQNMNVEELKTRRIAIIGYSGSFPNAENCEAYWNSLMAGQCAITEVPDNRFETIGQYTSQHDHISKYGGFLTGSDQFDYSFFNISKKEAKHMDPQHRLICEHAWSALENAGYMPDNLHNQSVGVFTGINNQEYILHLLNSKDQITHYSATGNARAFSANLVSHCLNLQGPSVSVDSTCSSSLAAIHLAMNSMLLGDCDMALVGSANLLIDPFAYVSLAKTGIFSKSNCCRVFDEKADGFIRSEGAGVLILKELDKARACNDSIYGVIVASRMAHQGKTFSITHPNLKSQIKLFESIYDSSGIDPASISYIEAGSTGTHMGDPVEIRSLKTVFSQYTSQRKFCCIGSIKNNIGHLECASGIAGIIKIILSMKFGKIPGTINIDAMNRFIDLENSPFFINQAPIDWNFGEQPRRAAINAFGFGGNNIQLIIEEYVKPENEREPSADQAKGIPNIFVINAQKKESLAKKIDNMIDFVSNNRELKTDDICYTKAIGRKDFMKYKISTVAESKDTLLSWLKNLDAHAMNIAKCHLAVFFPDHSADISFFRQLYGSFEFYKKQVDSLTNRLLSMEQDGLASFSLHTTQEDDNTSAARLAAFIYQKALADSLIELGVMPKMLLGNRLGKYLCLSVAKVMPFERLIRLICADTNRQTVLLEEGDLAAPNYPIFSLPTGQLLEQKPEASWIDAYLNHSDDAVVRLTTLNDPDNWQCLEISSQPRLTPFQDQNVINPDQATDASYVDANLLLPELISNLYNAGSSINWPVYYQQTARQRVSLPTYPFMREKCFI